MEFIDERLQIHTRIEEIAIQRVAEKLRTEDFFVKLADRGKLLPFEVLCRIGAVLRSGRGGIGVNRSCRRAFSIRKSPRAPSVLDGFYAFVIRNTGFDQIAVLVKIDVALAGLAVAVKKMPHKASAFFAVYPLTLIYLVHAGDSSFTLAADAVTVLPVVKPLAVVAVFYKYLAGIKSIRTGFAVHDHPANTASFVVLPFAVVDISVRPSVNSLAVPASVLPPTFIFVAVLIDPFAVAVTFAVLKAALIYRAVGIAVFSFGHLIVLPFAVK